MPKQANTKEQTVTSFKGDVIAVGQQTENADFALTIRTEGGDYMKVWHDIPLKRGTSVTVDKVTWPNGWVDHFIMTA